MAFDWKFSPIAPTIQCDLCPKSCVMGPGERGDCRIRVNLDGKLTATTFGLPSAVHLDPIEKKPLNHFHPGKTILSLATAGCNLHCLNCQNWNLSQANPEDLENFAVPPKDIVKLASAQGAPMVAFTYSEPLVFYEYTYESCLAARKAGLDTVLVTAGYANQAPLKRLFAATSAANIDLKAFSDKFYREVCRATLKPVLDGLVLAKEMDVWLEVTNLVIPSLNDDPNLVQDMARWMVSNLGPDTPLHFSGFYPRYKMKNLPPTPAPTLVELAEIARAEGIKYVYVGNVSTSKDQNTYCPNCKRLLVERIGYYIRRMDVGADNACPGCRFKIAGVWS